MITVVISLDYTQNVICLLLHHLWVSGEVPRTRLWAFLLGNPTSHENREKWATRFYWLLTTGRRN